MGPVTALETPLAAVASSAICSGVLPTFFGPSSRVLKNSEATDGNIAYVRTSSSEPSAPSSLAVSATSVSHSGVSRSAGRTVIGSFLACW